MKKEASRQAVENVVAVAVENFYKPGVSNILLSWHNEKSQAINAYDDMVYTNDEENIDMLLSGKSPSAVLRSINGVIKTYDAFIKFDGYGNLFSFHFDYFIETLIKGDNDLIDFIIENVSIKDLNKLHALSVKDKNEILKEALLND